VSSPQFNTRISSDLRDKYNGFVEQYKREKRISAKGDLARVSLRFVQGYSGLVDLVFPISFPERPPFPLS